MYRLTAASIIYVLSCAHVVWGASELTFTKIFDTTQIIPSTLEKLTAIGASSSSGENVAFIGSTSANRGGVYRYFNGAIQRVAANSAFLNDSVLIHDNTTWFSGAVNNSTGLWRNSNGGFQKFGVNSGVAQSEGNFIYNKDYPDLIVKVADGASQNVVSASSEVPGIANAQFNQIYPTMSIDKTNVAFASSVSTDDARGAEDWFPVIAAQIDGTLTNVLDSRSTFIPGTSKKFTEFELLGYDNGVIAFYGNQGIYTVVPGESPKLVADRKTFMPGTSSTFSGFRPDASSFTNGKLVFYGAGPNRAGLYSFDVESEFLAKAVDTESLLNGKRVTGVSLGRDAGDNNSFAFTTTFDDGMQAVYRGDFHPTTPHIVSVLFSGFSGERFEESGMRQLSRLENEVFSIQPDITFSSRAFEYDQLDDALAYVSSFDDVTCLIISGHSLGGLATYNFANQLKSLGKSVDLTIQIDSVGNDDVLLPSNVKKGFNYYQVTDGTDIQGARNIIGASNVNFEALFGDSTITHTSIDNDPGLQRLVLLDIAAACGISLPQNRAFQLITGSPTSISQQIATPTNPVDLSFDYKFESVAGDLKVLLNGVILAQFAAPTSLSGGFAHSSIAIGGALLGLQAATLEFVLDGPSGSRLLLDNIKFPGVVNGSLQLGDITGWVAKSSGHGSVQSINVFVPEPSTLFVGAIAVLCFGRVRLRQRTNV